MIAIIDIRTPKEICRSLEALGAELLFVPKDPNLSEPVSAHADMRLFILGKKLFISENAKNELSHISERLSQEGFETVLSSSVPTEKYPHDIAFNCIAVGNILLGNLKHTAPEILEEANRLGMSALSAKQGYTKCSTVVLDDKAVITADSSIYDVCISQGIDCLLIENRESDVSLAPYPYGFLGGASGVLGDTVYFCGNVELHSQYKKIKAFCQSKGKAVLSLGTERLSDIGSIFFI